MATQNGVIETATGDLLRAGSSDFENDGSFDAGTETYKTDVPVPAKIKFGDDANMHRWNGSAWVEVAAPVPGLVASLVAAYGTFQGRMDWVSVTTVTLAGKTGNCIDVNGESLDIAVDLIDATLDVADKLLTATGTEAAGAMIASTLYYVYVSSSLASYEPKSLRASATAPSTYRGSKYLGTPGNAAEWRFVGWVYTDGSTEFLDSDVARHVVNYYNRRPLSLLARPAYNDNNAETSYTHTNSSYAQVNGGTGGTVSYVANGEDVVSLKASFIGAHSNVASWWRAGIGRDSTTDPTRHAGTDSLVANEGLTLTVLDDHTPAVGRHTAEMLVVTGVSTLTLWADRSRSGASVDPEGTRMEGWVMG